MGGGSSKVSQLNKQITNISTSAMINNTTKCPLIINQSQEIIATGKAKITSVSLDQSAKINLSCFAKQDVNLKLQNEIKDKIKNLIKNDVTAQQFGYSKSATDIKNIVETNVEDHYSQTNIADMTASLVQKQVIQAHDESQISNVKMSQYASIVGKLVSDFTTDISREIRKDTDVSNKALAKTTSLMDSTMTGVNNILGTMFTWSTGTVIMGLGCCLCCVAMSYFSYKFTQSGSGIMKQIGAGLIPKSKYGRIFLVLGGVVLLPLMFVGYAYFMGKGIREERRQQYIKDHGVDPNNDEQDGLHYKERLQKRSLVDLKEDNIEHLEYRNRTRKSGITNGPIPSALPFSSRRRGYSPENKTVSF